MLQIARRAGRKLRGQFVEARENGFEIGLGIGRGHLRDGIFQIEQRPQDLVFDIGHRCKIACAAEKAWQNPRGLGTLKCL